MAPPVPAPAPRWRTPSSWPIALKLSIMLLGAALAPLALVVALMATSTSRRMDATARENVQLMATVTAARLDQLIADTRRVVGILANDDQTRRYFAASAADRAGLGESLLKRFNLIADSNPDWESVYILGADGIGLVSTNPQIVGDNYTFREYYRRAVAGEAFVTDMVVGKTTRLPGVYFSMPVRALRGETAAAGDGPDPIVGVAVLKLKGTRIWEIVNGVTIGDRGYAMLTDRNAVVMAHPDPRLLYHSVGTLPEAKIREIDPKASFNLDTIPPLPMEALRSPLTSPEPKGTAMFDAPGTNEDGEEESERWIAGFARMKERDWRVSVIQPISQFHQPLSRLIRQQLLIAVGVAALAGAVALWRARAVVRPVQQLTDAAKRLAEGDFEARATVTQGDEIGRLAGVFNDMVPKLKESVALQQSLAVVAEVQRSLLPAADPHPVRLDIAGRSRYCDAAGGDYFDFIDVATLSPSGTLLAVGDVMGHGLSAALLMASARAALRARAAQGGSLADMLTTVNQVLARDARHNQFMTMALVVLDPERGEARWASAGHDPAIVYHPGTDRFDELEGGDVPMGVDEHVRYEEYARAGLRPGTIIVVGTDGIWEMPGPGREMFGKQRLRDVIRSNAGRSASEIAGAIQSALEAFRASVAPKDDVTFVVARITA